MAHLINLGALTDELITLITSHDSITNPTRFNTHKDSAFRTIRSHNHPRTNQFDVSNRISGVLEKCRVLNRDSLADVLEERLSLLDQLEIKLAPEILHLLLELSDHPIENTNLADVDIFKEDETEPILKWKELIDEDPLLREKDVWRNVDFSVESDGDWQDMYEDTNSERSVETEVTVSSGMEEDFRRIENQVIHINVQDSLDRIKGAQFWRKIPSVGGVKLETVRINITELQTIREVLFMLAGLPTSLFELDLSKSAAVNGSKRYLWKHTSNDAYDQILESFADYGSALLILRTWTMRSQSIPLLQVLQSALQKRLNAFDTSLSRCQSRFVAITNSVVISLLSIHLEISLYVRPILRVTEITQRLDQEPYAHAFRYLEMLYDETCACQAAGDEELYAYTGRLFLECFHVYLRPLRTWMEDGELMKKDKVFFVSASTGDVDLTLLWNSRYQLRKTQDGMLHAPKFLRAAAGKIFNTGKSVVVLKHLNKFHTLQSANRSPEPSLDFETICQPPELNLAPFSDLFEKAFETWVQSKYHHASSLLRTTLFNSCSLHTSLNALANVHFLTNGATGSAFTNTIFEKLDTLDTSWNDRFTLTELARNTFGSLPSMAPEHVQTVILTLARKHETVAKCRTTVKALAIIRLRYHLSWPVQIILSPTALTSYQRIFTFLLQIRRCSHILARQNLLVDRLMKTNSSDERALYYSLRMRLLWFSQLLYNYLTSLVLEPASSQMREAMTEAEDVDDMVTVHASFIRSALDKSLLGSRLEMIHKSIIKILDLGIKLEDAQASQMITSRAKEEQQQEMMDRSLASLGIYTPRKGQSLLSSSRFNRSTRKSELEVSSSEDEDDRHIDVDLSILSSTTNDERREISYVEKLMEMKADFERMVRFVISGLKGVARAGGGEEGRSWDTLAEMLESGLGSGHSQW